jgi:DnaJ-class molecular chaperone
MAHSSWSTFVLGGHVHVKCNECGGSGRVIDWGDPKVDAAWERNDHNGTPPERQREIVARTYEYKCPDCNGTGVMLDRSRGA